MYGQQRMKRLRRHKRNDRHSSSVQTLDLQSQLISCTFADITSRLKDRYLTNVVVIDLSVNNLLTQDLQHI